MEKLLGAVLLPLRGSREQVIVVPNDLIHLAQRASLQQKERKQILRFLRCDMDNPNERDRIWGILRLLKSRGVPLASLFGIHLENFSCHYSEDYVRFRHASGLADAVHLSMLNLNITVCFLQKTRLRVSEGGQRRFIRSVRFRQGGLTMPYRTFYRRTSRNRRWHLTQWYLKNLPDTSSEMNLVKAIKYALVDAFCVQSEQERPEAPLAGGPMPLFPPATQIRLNKRFSNDRPGRVRFYKNLLESKSICAPVGADMISDAYKKHKESLCRPQRETLTVPQEFLQELYEYGKEVGKFVAKDYDPFRTSLPNTRATVEKNRLKGGARQALSERLEIHKGPLYLSLQDGISRPEPFVLGLFGPPGSGKTTSLSRLISSLGRELFPSRKGKELVYSRSCSTEHWDGYSGQPIVVLDDLGQNSQNRSDLVEFEHLVSTNRYVLPMAHLEMKGTEFSSPIILVTSNMEFGSRLAGDDPGSSILEDERAFWRRFHLPVQVYPTPPRSTLVEGQPVQFSKFAVLKVKWNGHTRTTVTGNIRVSSAVPSFWRNFTPEGVTVYETSRIRGTLELLERLILSYRQHVDFHAHNLTGEWRQTVKCLSATVSQDIAPFYRFEVEEQEYPHRPNDISISYLFPEYPPFHAPKVEAVAIPEPLKVRMITKAEASTKVLQPLQKSLFHYLKTKPQFCLTHGVSWGLAPDFDRKLEWIYRIENEIQTIASKRTEGDLWLSGDYTAATDNFPMSVTNALIEGLLSEIDHEPTKAWVRYEVSPHDIRYPGGEVGKQTSGQLMGSLLSFPLLCFLNDFIVSRSGFKEGMYLINGDDVVACGSKDVIDTWKCNAPKVGLDLSIGKNFIDQHFCCVNSQLFYDGRVQHTGKVSTMTRFGKSLSYCYKEAQFYYGFAEEMRREFIRRNLINLRRTPRSLDVPSSHGGLGLAFVDNPDLDARLARRVYIHDFLAPFAKSLPVPGFDYLRALRVPIGIYSDSEMELGGGQPQENALFDLLQGLDTEPRIEVEDSEEDLTNENFRRSESTYLKEENIRPINQILAHDFRQFPDLGLVRSRVIFVQKGRVGQLKKKVVLMALQLLLSHLRGRDFDPDEEFVEVVREIREPFVDPLFSSDFPFSMEEISAEEYRAYRGGDFASLPEKIYPFTSLGGCFWDDLFRCLVEVPFLGDPPGEGVQDSGPETLTREGSVPSLSADSPEA